MLKHKLAPIILAFAVLTACQKESENPNSGQQNQTIEDPADPPFSSANPQLSGNTVQASFVGKVTDLDGTSISGAQVSIGAQTTTTNSEGVFQVQSVSVDEQYALVKVSKSGFFKQFKNLIPRADKANLIIIKLIPRNFNGSFNTNEGGEIALDGGGRIEFSSGDLQTYNGESYSGEVFVATTYLNPTDPLLETYTPGSFLGVRNNDELSVLTSFGMVGTELFSENGQPLDLAPGSFARIEFPIQNEYADAAPQVIPLWFFDENTGIWREQGEAEIQDSRYIADVGHFTFWNVDIPSSPARISFQVLFNDEQITSNNVKVTVTRPSGGSSYSYLPLDGYVESWVPEGEELALKITLTSCGVDSDRDMSIGPFASGAETHLGDININDLLNTELVLIQGSIQNCQGDAITSVGEFRPDGQESGAIFIPENDGSFNFYTTICNDVQTTGILAYSFQEMLSESVESPWSSGQSSIDFETILLCSELDLDTYMIYEDGLGNFFGYEGLAFVPIEQEACNFAWHNDTTSGTEFLIYFEDVYGLGSYEACDTYGSMLSNPMGVENSDWLADFIEETLMVDVTEYTEVDGDSHIVEANWTCTVALTNQQTTDTTNAWGSFRVQIE